MTLNDMVIRIKDRSHRGNPAITTDEITNQIIRCINDARRELIRYVPRQFLRVDSPAPLIATYPTVLYSLDIVVQEPIIFRYTFDNVEYVLKRIESEREFYLTLFIKSQSPNRPFFYVEKGFDTLGKRQIEIYPIPDPVIGPFTINYSYYKDPTRAELTSVDLTTEFPDFPSYMQDAVWKGGLYHFLKQFDDQLGAVAKVDYDKANMDLQIAEDSDQDMELSLRWGFGKINYRDPTTGIRLL